MIKHLASIGLAALVLLGSGCVQDVGSIQVEGVCALPDDCSFPSGGCDDFILSRPVIDIGTARTLQLYLNVTNQLASGGVSGGVDTHTAYVDRISTSYSVLDGGFSLPGSGSTTLGTIHPGKTSTVKMYVVDEDAGADLAALAIPAWDPGTQNYVDMVVHVTVEGHFVDGGEFETEPFDLAFRVCNGCLGSCTTSVTCPPGADGQSPSICAAATP